jgi:hypothetical protein
MRAELERDMSDLVGVFARHECGFYIGILRSKLEDEWG